MLTVEKIERFLADYLKTEWDESIDGVMILSGEEGANYSQHCGKNTKFYISFEGSVLYSLLNFHMPMKTCDKFMALFDKFLTDNGGYYYELGNVWNLNIYKAT